MARMARIKNDYGTYYISQKSGGTRKLFLCDIDRERFLSILAKTQNQFQFDLYAYCILSSDEYHLVLNVNGGDLSKIMKSINISYAMYTNCDGSLFKDRFKSELLSTEEAIQEKIDSVHKRYKILHSLWNSYCTFKGLTPINIATRGNLPNCRNCMKTIEEAKQKLQEIAIEKKQSVSLLLKNKTIRNVLIRDFRKHSTLSLKALGQVFGGLSESSISKILNH